MYYPVGTGTLPVFSFREYCKDAGKDAILDAILRDPKISGPTGEENSRVEICAFGDVNGKVFRPRVDS